jgi:hypothetical protein
LTGIVHLVCLILGGGFETCRFQRKIYILERQRLPAVSLNVK